MEQLIHYWVIRKSRFSSVYVVFQKRSMNKNVYPGLFDVFAIDSLLPNENRNNGVKRFEKEMGVDDKHKAKYLGRIKNTKINNKEKQVHVYYITNSIPLYAYSIQRDETEGLYEILLSDLLQLLNNEVKKIPAYGVEKVLFISQKDLIPRGDYYSKIFSKIAKKFKIKIKKGKGTKK